MSEYYDIETGEIFKLVDEFGPFKVFEASNGLKFHITPEFLRYYGKVGQ